MRSDFPEITRRHVISGAVVAGMSWLTGCGEGRSDESTSTTVPPSATRDTGVSDAAVGTPARTTTETRTSSTGHEGLMLPSVTAPGSPGGPLDVRPPEKVILLDFFATWCAPCGPEMANLRAVRDRFSRDDLFIVSVTQETDQSAIGGFWARYDATWPVVMDPNVTATRAYDVTRLPTIILLAADSSRTFTQTGLVAEYRLIAAVEATLSDVEE